MPIVNRTPIFDTNKQPVYANFQELLYYILGIDIPALALINTFGFFVAMAFIAAMWVLSKELKRKETEGLIFPHTQMVVEGKAPQVLDWLPAAFIGFIIGYKILGLFLHIDWEVDTPQQYLLSSRGNWLTGLIVGGLFGYYTWKDIDKKKLPTPVEKKQTVHPYQLVGNITGIAAVAGILGAKVFHFLENWEEFIADPAEQFANFFSGLTFYGGFITATLFIWLYIRKKHIALPHLFDSAAPVLILAYGIGRIGCQVSGDGDWGVINSAYRIDEKRNYTVVPPDSILAEIPTCSMYYNDEPNQKLDYIYFEKPKALSFLPNWVFAYDFRNNVLNKGVPINGCKRNFCHQLPLPVFPTAFYEVLMALAIFGFLWAIRKKIKTPFTLFFIYLIFNGLERFTIEKIRVNTKGDFFGITMTQAEFISTILFLIGVIGVIITIRSKKHLQA